MSVFTQCDSPVDLHCIIYTGDDIPCLGITTGMRMDNIFDIMNNAIATCCSVDCVVSAWSEWSECNPETLTRSRTRTIITPASVCGTACPSLIETEDCEIPVTLAFDLDIASDDTLVDYTVEFTGYHTFDISSIVAIDDSIDVNSPSSSFSVPIKVLKTSNGGLPESAYVCVYISVNDVNIEAANICYAVDDIVDYEYIVTNVTPNDVINVRIEEGDL